MGSLTPRRPSPSMIVAGLALFVALGSGAYATVTRNSVGTLEIRDGSIRSVDIRNGEVRRPDIRPHSVDSARIANGTIRLLDMHPTARVAGGKAAFAGGEQAVGLDTLKSVRQVTVTPPANGRIVAFSTVQVSNFGAGSEFARCSIGTGSALDLGYLQLATLPPGGAAQLSGTRAFTVTRGAPRTVRLVCDGTASVAASDSALSAIFIAG